MGSSEQCLCQWAVGGSKGRVSVIGWETILLREAIAGFLYGPQWQFSWLVFLGDAATSDSLSLTLELLFL